MSEIAKALATLNKALADPSTPKPTFDEIGRREMRNALQAQPPALIEPTAEETRNGWTAQTLTDYHHGQKAAQSLRIDPSSVLRRKAPPVRANSKYRPLRWRA